MIKMTITKWIQWSLSEGSFEFTSELGEVHEMLFMEGAIISRVEDLTKYSVLGSSNKKTEKGEIIIQSEIMRTLCS